MTDAVETPAVCPSCGQRLAGASYCSSCGEEVLDARKLTLRYFVTHAVLHELLNVDGKIWRTLKYLLFRPGFLALEYAAGRRRPYVGPVRVLLVAIIAYALATQSGIGFTLAVGPLKLSMAPAPMSPGRSIEATIEQVDRFGVLERMFTQRFGPVANASDEVRARFNRSLDGFATPLSFTTVLLVALPLHALFHRRRPLLVEHAVFSMHYFSFVLLSLLFVVLVLRLRLTGSFVFSIGLLLSVNVWQFAYLATALRRFYFDARRRPVLAWAASFVIAVFVYLLNSLYITAIQFAGGAYAIARL
ncbi:MAG TPA: DUF3667 domain-containing protein [Gammaproteobacteria bacterium]